MTTTRLAFSSALVLLLSAFVCNAQRELPGMGFNLVYLLNSVGTARCMLEDALSQDEIEQVGNQQLQCVNSPGAFPITCVFEGETCESLQNTCNDLNGQITSYNLCEEIVV